MVKPTNGKLLSNTVIFPSFFSVFLNDKKLFFQKIKLISTFLSFWGVIFVMGVVFICELNIFMAIGFNPNFMYFPVKHKSHLSDAYNKASV